MKNQFYILLICVSICSLVLQNCSYSSSENTVDDAPIIFKEFNDLPHSPFLNFGFNDELEALKLDLINQGYIEHLTNTFRDNQDSTTVIFEDELNLTTFKVYLSSHFYLTNSITLFERLKAKSSHCVGSSEFAEIEFNTDPQPFKLTYFTTEKSIRISYQLITSPH